MHVACFHSISAEGAPGLIVRASFGYTHDMHISRDPELELEPERSGAVFSVEPERSSKFFPCSRAPFVFLIFF